MPDDTTVRPLSKAVGFWVAVDLDDLPGTLWFESKDAHYRIADGELAAEIIEHLAQRDALIEELRARVKELEGDG